MKGVYEENMYNILWYVHVLLEGKLNLNQEGFKKKKKNLKMEVETKFCSLAKADFCCLHL